MPHSPPDHRATLAAPATKVRDGDPHKLYICPGETHPISRAVHLSRLAAFFPACRDCPFRCETGHLPRGTVAQLQSTEHRIERPTLFTTEGVRGVYLNELTRNKAGDIAMAFASRLWEDAPLMGRPELPRTGARRPGPTVVIGSDERPSSPDLLAGVAEGLRRMGCQVIDVDVVTKPCFWFAVDHLQAAGGMRVTGDGCGPSWTGLDFVARGAAPMSRLDDAATDDDSLRPQDLRRVEEQWRAGVSRPSRQAGPQRMFQAQRPYEAGLVKHFHALRPLHVCCATPTLGLQRLLERLFAELPCRLTLVPIPQRARNLHDAADADLVRLGDAIRQTRADCGLLMDDDGQRCVVFDETGSLVPPAVLAARLAADLLREHPGSTVIGESPETPLSAAVVQAGGRYEVGGSTIAEVSRAMRAHQAVFGGGESGRYWFRESFPTIDAILTLARTLGAMSRSDAPLSVVCETPAV